MSKFKHFLITAGAMLCAGSLALNAQPEKGLAAHAGRPEERHEARMIDPEESVRNVLDRLKPVLDLTEKQYGKLYKLLLKEEKRMRAWMYPVPPVPETDEGPGHGPGMGTPPAPHGGIRPGMRPVPTLMPDGPEGHMADPADMEKMHRKAEKKIKRILTDEQYRLWSKERGRHGTATGRITKR